MNRLNETLYFRDLNRYQTLSPEEEKILLRMVREGDERALKRLI